jgi:hypothetical protein
MKGEIMNKFGSLRKRLLIAASATLVAIAVPAPAHASAQTAGEVKCDASDKTQSAVLTVTGMDSNKNFKYTMKCYDTFGNSLRAIGVSVSADVTPAKLSATLSPSAALLDSVIGIHYDAGNLSGAALTVNGSTCNGGGLNVPIACNDRISSTYNGCGTIQHFENTNYGGTNTSTFGSGSGTSFTGLYIDNRTSAIKYF